MSEVDKALSVEELETLCRQYIECKLSVLEETELYYVLLKSDKDSMLLNETRAIMGIEHRISSSQMPEYKNKRYLRRIAMIAVAAVIIGVIVFSVIFSHYETFTTKENTLLTVAPKENNGLRTEGERSYRTEEDLSKIDGAHNMGQEQDASLTEEDKSETPTDLYGNNQNKGNDLTYYDDYIEITDVNEANSIILEIDGKLSAILEKRYNIQKNLPDVNEIMNQIINKI